MNNSECCMVSIFSSLTLEQHMQHIYNTRNKKATSIPPPPYFEVLISFCVTLSYSVPRHCTSRRGLVLRARECASPTEDVPIRSLLTGRLASGGDSTREPLHRKRAWSHYTTQPINIQHVYYTCYMCCLSTGEENNWRTANDYILSHCIKNVVHKMRRKKKHISLPKDCAQTSYIASDKMSMK